MEGHKQSENQLSIQFLGAAETVTGSKFLIQTPQLNIMVDCGLFQGVKKMRKLNWEPLPFDPAKIDAVLLTHAHLDHVGYLPRLVKQGFEGAIIGTQPTLELAEVILFDSAKIQEEEADMANKKGYSKHKPALPLYTYKDVKATLPLFEPGPVERWMELSDDIRFRMKTNSHILGAVFIEIEAFGKTLVFSGDIGREEDLLLHTPHRPLDADVLVMESTYGDRLHAGEQIDVKAKLAEVVNTTYERGGTLIIPSFALERAQSLIYLLGELKSDEAIPDLPVFLDSPMGSEVSMIFNRQLEWHRLSREDCNAMFRKCRFVRSFKETVRIARDEQPKIIIAGSGMVTGGRVLHYLKHYLEDPNSTVLLVGFQAEGTRGRQLKEGASEVKIHGEWFPVLAEVTNTHSLSGHADQGELVRWAGAIQNTPEQVFLVHGERQASDTLRIKIRDTHGWECEIPEMGEIFIFDL